MFKTLLTCLAGAVCLGAALPAAAAPPTVTLNFNQPSGVVGPTDNVEVWVTLTVDSGSSPLVFDVNLPSPFGFAPGDLPTHGFHNDPAHGSALVAFASYTYVETGTYIGCSGSFIAPTCAPDAYVFNGHFPGTPAAPTFLALTALNLQPGQSMSYLFGTFTPNGGPVPEGTYTFYRSGATLVVSGLDAEGHAMFAGYTLGDTCAAQVAACAFTRTVVAVPEPRTYGLMVLGLAAIGVVLRRRRDR